MPTWRQARQRGSSIDAPTGTANTNRQEDRLETLDEKRARLRGELQEAHSAWLLESEGAPANAAERPLGSQSTRSIYLAAKHRLTAAYAEEAPATHRVSPSNGTASASI